jgi:serine/threonine protein kinase
MISSEQNNCPGCGARLPQSSKEELCPACAMSQALNVDDESAETMPPDGGSGGDGTISFNSVEPSVFPCELGGYRLLGKLGQGGMGSVYEAEELTTGRRLALKMLSRRLDSPDMRQRFLREGRLAASVSHPNTLYVFGTEEIEDHPVITMELASGGTLSDRLKTEGRLPVTEAVDAILNIIDGLEAAFAGGVLHRDVKPSNCFVSPDSSLKVGDFGWSVSTTAQVDSFMTATGLIMGTPAYAPPEQLRGRDLDVRADIYSVGATLFTLLTNKPPIEGKNAVEIVAAALEQKPKLLSELREEVPSGLARIVARCLAKQPDQRFPGYSELRNALLAFSSVQPEPAPLGRRFLASIVDAVLFGLIPSIVIMALWGIDAEDVFLRERTSTQFFGRLGLEAIVILYFTVCEGLWGASIGKSLMGCQVIRTNGAVPGLGRSFLRILIPRILVSTRVIVPLLAYTAASYDDAAAGFTGLLGLTFFLCFVTMRRRNGFATVWDLATATRVVQRPKGAERPVINLPDRSLASGDEDRRIGPFLITNEIVPGDWLEAQDPALRRSVWLRRRSESGMTATRRDLARPGRSRWLQGVQTSAGDWDVFEAQAGVPLSELANSDAPVTWGAMRHWLHDLASEVASAAKDETLPDVLSLDHVWITGHGRAILLDEAWPKIEQPAATIAVGDHAGRQRFLQSVAELVAPNTVPLHAREVLESLAMGSFEKLSFLAGSLRALLTKRITIDRWYRAASLLTFPAFIVMFLTLAFLADQERWNHRTPRMDIWRAAQLGQSLNIGWHADIGTDLNVQRSDSGGTPLIAAASRGHTGAVWALLNGGADVNLQNYRGDTALHAAAFFCHPDTLRVLLARGANLTLTNHVGMTPLNLVSPPWSGTLKQVYQSWARQPDLKIGLKRIERLRPDVARLLQNPVRELETLDHIRAVVVGSRRGPSLIAVTIFLCVLLAVSQLVSLLAVRGSIGQFVFGFALVDGQGRPAERGRLFGRWVLVWLLPCSLPAFIYGFLERGFDANVGFCLVLFIGWWVVLFHAIAHPRQGLHDKMSGCWLVRR